MKMFIKINYAKVQTNYEIAVYIMQSDMRFWNVSPNPFQKW
jgi:hypothetical protein